MDLPGSRGASGGTTGRGGGRVADVWGGAAGLATTVAAAAEVLTEPISIVLPARSPPWSVSSLTRIAVTLAVAARGGFCTESTLDVSTSSVPQSASETTRFGA